MASLVASEETESVRRRGSNVPCPICLEPLVDAVQLKPCEHQFCAGCASTFLRMNADTHCAPCPICRSPSELGAVVLAATGENLLEHQLREKTPPKRKRKPKGSVLKRKRDEVWRATPVAKWKLASPERDALLRASE